MASDGPPAWSDRTLFIVGSARAGGNTARMARHTRDLSGGRLIDLGDLAVAPYRYRDAVQDDFNSLVDAMLSGRHLVFATPVYWYAMSGMMKTAFDRLTDLLDTPAGKRRGRALAGRCVSLLATGKDAELPRGFAEPFPRTADWFNMRWIGSVYVRFDAAGQPFEAGLEELARFASRIAKAG